MTRKKCLQACDTVSSTFFNIFEKFAIIWPYVQCLPEEMAMKVHSETPLVFMPSTARRLVLQKNKKSLTHEHSSKSFFVPRRCFLY